MGQYHRHVILEKNFKEDYRNKKAEVVLTAWDYGMGAKQMETSYLCNPLCGGLVEHLLAGEFYGYPYVYAGDYSDDIRIHIDEDVTRENFREIYPVEDYGEEEIIPYDFDSKYKGDLELQGKETRQYRYLINLSKNEYVDLVKYDTGDTEDIWVVHPLPLLCCNSKQRGGGDYHGVDEELLGIWAYDCIGFTNELPEGMDEIEVHFAE